MMMMPVEKKMVKISKENIEIVEKNELFFSLICSFRFYLSRPLDVT